MNLVHDGGVVVVVCMSLLAQQPCSHLCYRRGFVNMFAQSCARQNAAAMQQFAFECIWRIECWIDYSSSACTLERRNTAAVQRLYIEVLKNHDGEIQRTSAAVGPERSLVRIMSTSDLNGPSGVRRPLQHFGPN